MKSQKKKDPMASTLLKDLKGVLQFVSECDGYFPTSKCEVKSSVFGGLGVYAVCDLKEGETLLQLPKSCVFSASNSSVANLLVDGEIDGMLALIIAFIYETSIFKEKSHWYPYLKSVRIAEENELYLPPNLWDSHSKIALKGSTLDTLHHGLDEEEEVQQGYEIALNLARQWNAELGWSIPEPYFNSFQHFVAVAYAISSRVFEIDNYHESALVPVADLFNHKAHRDGPHVRFVSLYEVCSDCGEPGMCRHLVAEAAQEREDEAAAVNEQHHDDGVIDTQMIEELEGQEDETSEVQEKGLLNNVHPDECVDIVVTRDVPKGQEIFNSYGELSNALLLARYGFCVEDNPWDMVYLGNDLLKLLKDKELKIRAKWWDFIGYELYQNWCALNKEDDDEEEGDKDEYDSDDSEEEQEGKRSWLSEVFVDHRGSPSSSMKALLNLLALSRRDWDKLRAIEKDVESLGNKIGILDMQLNRISSKILLRLVTARQQKLSSPSEIRNPSARLMLQSEHEILQKAQENLRKC